MKNIVILVRSVLHGYITPQTDNYGTTDAGTLDLPYQQFFCALEPHGRGPPANLSRHWTNDAETGLCEMDNRVEADRPRSVNLALRDPHLGTCKFNQS